MHELTMFHVDKGPVRFYDFKDNVHFAITYEMSRDLLSVNRKVYSVLDLLGDVGGLTGSLHAIFALAIFVFQYKATLNDTSTRTYLIEEGDDQGPPRKGNQADSRLPQ